MAEITVTVRLAVPCMPLPDAAVIVTVPGTIPVATLLAMDATVAAEVDQVTEAVTSLLVPSL